MNITKAKVIESSPNSDSYEKGLTLISCDFNDVKECVTELGGLIIVHGGDKHGSIEQNMSHSKDPNDLDGIYKSLDIKKTEIMKYGINIIELPNINKSNARNMRFYNDEFDKPCIVSSDSHTKEDYENRFGEVFTWIKSDLSFEGLKQVIVDYPDRVFIGESPELLNRIYNQPTKYISRINIDWAEEYNGKKGIWFKDIDVPINPGLVSIIGNKGSGKSALLEIIALLSKSTKNKHFSFLTNKKFHKNRISKNFDAKIKFYSENEYSLNLYDTFDENDVELVQFMPQNYFEELCNEDLAIFSTELNKVVFSHIEDADKEGTTSFEELLELNRDVLAREKSNLLDELERININIIDKEKKSKNEYLDSVKFKLDDVNKKIEAIKKNEPKEIDVPDMSLEEKAELDTLTLQKQYVESEIKKQEDDINLSKGKRNRLLRIKERIDYFVNNEIYQLKRDLEIELNSFDINFDDVFSFNYQSNIISKKTVDFDNRIDKIQKNVNENKLRLSKIIEKISSIDVNNKKQYEIYNNYIQQKESWTNNMETLLKERLEINKEITYLNEVLPGEISKLSTERIKFSKKIFDNNQKMIAIFMLFKKPIDRKIELSQESLQDYNIEIKAGIVPSGDFSTRLFDYINKGRRNPFKDIEYDINKMINEIDDFSFDDYDKIEKFLELFYKKMNGFEEHIHSQIKDNRVLDLYNYIFGLDFLENSYNLTIDNKNLDQLSPGERGALLLVFYLMLDTNDIPLLLDQPEDNLDNQSITDILVPFIKEAKKRRQIIIVTHNPNLSIVGDSDQVIVVNIDKTKNFRFNVLKGSVENTEVNDSIVNILEGKMKSFRKRDNKYIK